MRWHPERTGLEDWGGAPTRIEVVRGSATLRALAPARRVVATPLSADGRKAGKGGEASPTDGGWRFRLGASPTAWYAIDVER